MNKRLTLILILILIGLFTLGIVSCSAWLAEKPADATVTISPVKIQGDSIQSTKLIYDVEIVNNGRNDIKVTSFDAVMSFFGGAYELPIKDIINLKVEAKTTETFVFKKEINVEEIMDSIENFENIESSELKFEGKLRLANMDDVENFSTFSVVDNLPIAKAPIVKGAEIKLDEADYHFAMFAFEIVIENVNPFEIELVPDYEIYINNRKATQDKIDTPLKIEPATTVTRTLKRRINLVNNKELMLNSSTAKISVQGTLSHTTLLGTYTTLFANKSEIGKYNLDDYEKNIEVLKTLNIPLLPSIEVDAVSVKQQSGKDIVNMILKVGNKNNFDIEIKKWIFDVDISDFGTALNLVLDEEGEPATIKPTRTEEVPISLNVTEPDRITEITGDFIISVDVYFESLLGEDDVYIPYKIGYSNF